jgi:hypothetical protein
MLAQLPWWKVDVQLGFLLLTAALAWRWGAAPERFCTACLLYMKFIDWPYHWITGQGAILLTVDIGHFLIDLTTGIALYLIAIRANRLFPLWLAALQLIAIFSHFARELSSTIEKHIYAAMIVMPSYLQIIILLTGIALHHRRAKALRRYPPWIGLSGHLQASDPGASRPS